MVREPKTFAYSFFPRQIHFFTRLVGKRSVTRQTLGKNGKSLAKRFFLGTAVLGRLIGLTLTDFLKGLIFL
jgi:hypothetical protein